MALEQAELLEDPVSIDIVEMLNSLSKKSPNPCISKVPNYLRQVNEKAYEPQVISIGPYHRGKDHLEAMEKQKIRFLQKLLEEIEENDVSVYVMKIRELKDTARKWYADPVSDLDSDDFVKVLLLDGVFIVQILRWCSDKRPLNLYDVVGCYSNGLWLSLCQDMLLVENQLPFFVLRELFCMIERSRADQDMIFMEAIISMLGNRAPAKRRPRDDLKSPNLSDIKHILDFMYHCCFHPSTSEDDNSTSQEKNELNFIRCATELKEDAIKFKLIDGDAMFDIRFENGTLHIPEIKIGDDTEPFLRNLIAYEQLFLVDRDLKHATDYMLFMDCLIDSPNDVEILCQHGIIKNMLGDDNAVAAMINSLGFGVVISPNFYYTEVFNKINAHRGRRWTRWMARWDRWMENLKDKYFNSPWAFISFLAASLILLLTLLQTVISVLSYAQ